MSVVLTVNSLATRRKGLLDSDRIVFYRVGFGLLMGAILGNMSLLLTGEAHSLLPHLVSCRFVVLLLHGLVRVLRIRRFSFGFEDCFDFRGSDEGSGAYGPTFLSFISLSMISAFRLYSLNGKSRNKTIAFLISSCNPRRKLLSIKSEWIRLPRVFSSISFSTITSLTGRFPCLIARYLSIAIWKCSGG